MKRRIGTYFLALFLLTSLSSCGYNSLVEKQERVESAWAQVENVYQRRADLIPNLVETVKAETDFEQETLEKVMQARAQATSVNISADNLNQEKIQKYQKAQEQLSGSLSRLMMVSERYPKLQSNQAFQDLRVQIEGSENRISTERRRFNEAVRDYNTAIRKFPKNLTASMFGFEKKGYFEADKGAEKAPDVNFSDEKNAQ